MLNKIWPIFIIISFIYAFFAGTVEQVNTGIFESTDSAVKLSITLLGTMCLWNGIMQIAYQSKLVNVLVKLLNPIINLLFPDLKNNEKIKKEILMNIIANLFGIGNAATPLGIKAINSLQEENNNKDTLSNSMMMLIVLNTASLQIIPTTVIAIRNSLHSNNSSSIIVPVWIATICSVCIGIISTKFLMKIVKK